MTTDTYDIPAGGEDPLLVQGRAHLQAGRWQEAIGCFEELARRRPDDPALARLLEEARFKARLDAGTQVRARRWLIPWRRVALGGVIVALLAFIVIQGSLFLNRQLAPSLARAQRDQQVAGLLKQGNTYLEAENYDGAEQAFKALLALAPEDTRATAGLAQAGTGREIAGLYAQALKHYQSGDYPAALAGFTDLSLRKSGYRDVDIRIAEIRRVAELDQTFAGAEADLTAGRFSDALSKYQQLQAMSATYKRDIIAGRVFDLYLLLGKDIVEGQPPVLAQVPQALEWFTRAASLRPGDREAAVQQRLAADYLAGQQAYNERRFDEAVSRLAAVSDQRPDYLAGAPLAPLYDAYLQRGEAFRAAGDFPNAWEQYRRAAALPIADTAAARARMSELQPFMTPTPTPSPTPTSTAIPTPTALDLGRYIPSLRPTGTPGPPLSSFRNQIIFFSDKEDQPGLWAMNPDGSNRRYLGPAAKLQKEYDALREKETWSPDGRYRTYTFQSHSDKTPQIYIQGKDKDQFGNLPTWEVTHLSKVTYDPVWAPDGGHLAFDSQEAGSDDIFTIRPDGTDIWNRTKNTWEWDKHPSWSPDSARIVFWTNREGTKQIYVMDWEGRNQVNISKVAWDEYDPIWVK